MRNPINRSPIVIWSIVATIVIVVLALYFIAQQLPANAQGYEAFFAALGAVGACITGIALSVFAYLTWAVSYRQQEMQLFPSLLPRAVYTYPHHGERVFETTTKYFHGIKWEIEIINPGSVPVEIIRNEFGIQNSKNGKSSEITGLPCHDIYDEQGALVYERGFFMRPNQLEKRTLVIYYDEFESELADMIGVSDRKFVLYYDLRWLSKGREQFRSVQSSVFYLSRDAVFGCENK